MCVRANERYCELFLSRNFSVQHSVRVCLLQKHTRSILSALSRTLLLILEHTDYKDQHSVVTHIRLFILFQLQINYENNGILYQQINLLRIVIIHTIDLRQFTQYTRHAAHQNVNSKSHTHSIACFVYLVLLQKEKEEISKYIEVREMIEFVMKLEWSSFPFGMVFVCRRYNNIIVIVLPGRCSTVFGRYISIVNNEADWELRMRLSDCKLYFSSQLHIYIFQYIYMWNALINMEIHEIENIQLDDSSGFADVLFLFSTSDDCTSCVQHMLQCQWWRDIHISISIRCSHFKR